MKRDTKILLLVLFFAFVLVTLSPKMEDLYRKNLAKNVVSRWRSVVEKYSTAWKVNPEIVLAIICQESGGNPDSLNPSDPSRGLMQITPGALEDFNRIAGRSYTFEEMFDPYLNVEVGTWYFATRLSKTLETRKALAAYNAGLGNIPAGFPYADKVLLYLTYVKEIYVSL